MSHDVTQPWSCLPCSLCCWAGNIATWNKKEGEEVAAGDSIADIETDKATMTWEAQDEGFIAKILVAEGTQDVQVGAPVVVFVEDKVPARVICRSHVMSAWLLQALGWRLGV